MAVQKIRGFRLNQYVVNKLRTLAAQDQTNMTQVVERLIIEESMRRGNDHRMQFVIEKLVEEVNCTHAELEGYTGLYPEEVEEINEAIRGLGIDTKLTTGRRFDQAMD